MIEQDDNLANDVLWGVEAISSYIQRSQRQTYYLIATGGIPAKKLGAKTIVARKSELDRALGAANAQ
ncbi:MAG: DNA-binding protein [Pseudolabrys sp.]|nr:DNA-binding protein [Pseudolabrys sp.]